MREQALQQMYGIYRANLACKEYALMADVKYVYKIRLRPDTAFVKPFPDYVKMDMGPKNGAVGQILFANNYLYKSASNVDWFNVGYTRHMDFLLDRYIDFITTPFVSSSKKAWWDLENHLAGLMGSRYKVLLRPENGTNTVRTRYYKYLLTFLTHFSNTLFPHTWIIQ